MAPVFGTIVLKKCRKVNFNHYHTFYSNISVGTLRNQEQGRRKPEGPARVLLVIADKHPEALLAL